MNGTYVRCGAGRDDSTHALRLAADLFRTRSPPAAALSTPAGTAPCLIRLPTRFAYGFVKEGRKAAVGSCLPVESSISSVAIEPATSSHDSWSHQVRRIIFKIKMASLISFIVIILDNEISQQTVFHTMRIFLSFIIVSATAITLDNVRHRLLAWIFSAIVFIL